MHSERGKRFASAGSSAVGKAREAVANRAKAPKKLPKRAIRRSVIALVMAITLAFTSLSTVIANTVTATVIDGDQTYSFNMGSSDIDEILEKAFAMGLEPINEEMDICERAGNTTTINIRRGVAMNYSEAGNVQKLQAYKGDTVEQTLLANGIILKEKDEVSPARDTIVDSALTVEVKRHCTVTIAVDGGKKEVSLTGKTVRDAIKIAGVKIGPDDDVNYPLDRPLTDQMTIRVIRNLTVTIAADGETKTYKVAADTVREAIDKAKIELSEHDRVTPKLSDKAVDQMEIEIKRVTVEEVTVKEEIDFEVVTEDSPDMYTNESKVKTEGVRGEKEVTYKVTTVEGEEEGKEVLSEKVLKEPVTKVMIQGTKKRPSSSGGGGSATVGNGTLVDHNGNTVSYRKVLNGTASAYSDGGLTATGAPCGYGNVAVNPNVIPYGSKLYICSPDGSYVYGYATASDTGGALMSGRILVDLWMESESACYSFGLKNMNVYIVN